MTCGPLKEALRQRAMGEGRRLLSTPLAHLAHVGRGPRYVIVGGKAWYDPADIRAWLEARKQYGPSQARQVPERISARAVEGAKPKRRGRPTKLEQMTRRLGRFPSLER
jgi:hypothetical protein